MLSSFLFNTGREVFGPRENEQGRFLTLLEVGFNVGELYHLSARKAWRTNSRIVLALSCAMSALGLKILLSGFAQKKAARKRPDRSHLGGFRDGECVFDVYTQVTHCTVHLGVTKQ